MAPIKNDASPLAPAAKSRTKRAFRHVPAYGLSPRAVADDALPRAYVDPTSPVDADDALPRAYVDPTSPVDAEENLPSTTPCPRCGQEQLITSLPLACSACGMHLLGAPPPTFDMLLATQIVDLEAEIAGRQQDEDQLRRTITRRREQLALLQQYHALTTEEP